MDAMDNVLTFTAIRGIQAGREYYGAMCPLKVIPRIFIFDEEELTAELRAQRTLNRSRIPEMATYIVDNPRDYIFSSITASAARIAFCSASVCLTSTLAGTHPRITTPTFEKTGVACPASLAMCR